MNKSAQKRYHECVAYYKSHINDADYIEYLQDAENKNLEIHREYVEKEKPEWKKRTDLYGSNGDKIVGGIKFADVLSNEEVSKLLKKIYGLSTKDYEIDVLYKKPDVFHRYDYIHMRYEGSSTAHFATIKFKIDKYIEKIEIFWCQINSFFAYLEYEFVFREKLESSKYDAFILDRINIINTQKDYYEYYGITSIKVDNYISLTQMHQDFFRLICQHYITSLLFSREGKKHKLINMVMLTRKKPIEISKIYLSDNGFGYYYKKDNFFIITDYKETDYILCAGQNQIPHFSLIKYVAKYGNRFFLNMFGQREIKIFECEFSKYISGRKKITYNKEYYQLLRKIQGLSSVETKKISDFYDEFNWEWDFYIANKKADIASFHKFYRNDIKEIYVSSFEYMKINTEINNALSNKYIAILALVISIIALFVS